MGRIGCLQGVQEALWVESEVPRDAWLVCPGSCRLLVRVGPLVVTARRPPSRQPVQSVPDGQGLQSHGKEVVGEPYEGKPYVRLEVAGDGDQDAARLIEALSEEAERRWLASSESQVPFPDTTT